MPKLRFPGVIAVVACGLGLSLAASSLPAAAPRASESVEAELGITKPSEELELGFPQPFLVSKVPVKEGTVVKKGDLLAAQDDAADQIVLAQMDILAKSRLQEKAQEADMKA